MGSLHCDGKVTFGLVLAPVCVVAPRGDARPEQEGKRAQLHGFMPGGTFPLRELQDGEDPTEMAETMGRELLDTGSGPQPAPDQPVRKVGFFTADETGLATQICLVYTTAVPWCLEDPPGDAWWPLPADLPAAESDPIGFAVRDEWRQLAEETTAGLELLPKYFTIPEAQEVYQAIWAIPSLPNFHRWVKSNPGMVTPVTPQTRASADAQLRTLATATSTNWEIVDKALGEDNAADTAVTHSSVAATAIAAALGPAGLLAFGSTRGYRNLRKRRRPDAKERGRQPDYYTRGSVHRLNVIYAPRPSWDTPQSGD